MFDFKNLGDMAKIANQAKELQRQQDQRQQEQMDILKRIYGTLNEILIELRSRKKEG